MKSSNEIFRLIKSMSKKEKQFFRKKALLFYADDDNNYRRLFDEIALQAESGDEYDEGKIKNGNYTGKFIKNLSVHKNYLYSMLLESLEMNRKDNIPAATVRSLLSQAELLADRLLYDQSLKIIQRAKRITEEKNILQTRYELINLERTILKYTLSAKDYELKNGKLFDEQERLIEINKNLIEYYRLNEAVGVFLRSQGAAKIREKETEKKFRSIFSNPMLKDISSAKSFTARYIFNNLNLQFHLTFADYESAYNFAKAGTELWEANPEMLKGKLDNYIFSLSNLINTQIRTRRHDDLFRTVKKLRNIPEKFSHNVTDSNRAFIFYSASVSEMVGYVQELNPEKLKELVENITAEMQNHEKNIHLYQRIILYYFISMANFVLAQYENCVFWNSRIFNIGKTDLSEDYQCYARIIQLISYYELGYLDSLEYALRSAYHFISNRKKVYEYERIIQQYLRRSFRIRSDEELYRMFDDMKFDLEKIATDEYERNAFDAFDIRPWLESKIRRVSLIELLKARHKHEKN